MAFSVRLSRDHAKLVSEGSQQLVGFAGGFWICHYQRLAMHDWSVYGNTEPNQRWTSSSWANKTSIITTLFTDDQMKSGPLAISVWLNPLFSWVMELLKFWAVSWHPTTLQSGFLAFLFLDPRSCTSPCHSPWVRWLHVSRLAWNRLF